LASVALAAPPPGKGRPGGETAGNNLSFPAIFSDGTPPTGEYTNLAEWLFYAGPWSDANGDGVYDQCTQGVPAGTAVPDQYLCYQTADLRVWWLQERAVNRWQAFDPANDGTSYDFGDVVVSAVDWGDLLESSPNLNARKIRTEVWMLKDADGDPALTPYLATAVAGGSPGVVTCPDSTTACFAAVRMSGAVPGTEQSINEVQGTDYGAATGNVLGTRELIDPATVKFDAGAPVGYESTLYSTCARLLIQPLIAGQTPQWSSTTGVWSFAGSPVVNIRALTGDYSAEINAGGFMLYGYNWSAKGLTPGMYRLTFVLDGPDSNVYACNGLKTYFDETTRVFVTPGEEATAPAPAAGEPVPNKAFVVPSCAKVTGAEVSCVDGGGLSYIDVVISKATGGKPQ
jgi:hypothetical protein